VEAKPARVIDHGKGAPKIRGIVEREWRCRQEIQVGQDGMKRQHEKDDKRPQIVERPTGPRHQWAGSRGGTHRSTNSSAGSSAVCLVSSNSNSGSNSNAGSIGTARGRCRPIRAGWNNTAAAIVQSSDRAISFPMLEVPGSLDSQRLPNAVAWVMALKITARVRVDCTSAVFPLRHAMM